jgi:uncharacterized protein YggE
MKRFILALLLAPATVLFAQPDSNSISIVASRSVYAQPDQIAFFISVTSGGSATLDDILKALAGAGVTASDYQGVFASYDSTPGQPDPWPQYWSFSLGVPFSTMKETLAALTGLQQTIPQKNSGLNMSFSLGGLQVSPQLLASQQCSNRDLIADARAQAEKLAHAAGFAVGSILTISKPMSVVPTAALLYPQLAAGTPTIRAALPGSAYTFATYPAPQPTTLSCSLQVEFAMLR